MDFQQIRKYVKGVLTNSFLNKTTLDKLSTSDEGNLLFDGKEISGGGSSQIAYGGIDTSNVIYELTSSVEGTEWVATEDCYFIGELVGGNNNGSNFAIDGVGVGTHYSSSTISSSHFPILVLKGQTVKYKAMSGDFIRTGKFYGIKKSENILHEYNTEEKIVGKWIDGKPIYEKVIIIDNPPSGVDVLYSHGISNFNHVININVVYITNGGIEYSEPIYLGSNFARSCAIDSTNLYITTKGGNYIQLYVTIQYTKTTD